MIVSTARALAAPNNNVLYAGVIFSNGGISFSATNNFTVTKGNTGEYFIEVEERVECRHEGTDQFALGPRIAATTNQFQYATSPIFIVASDDTGVCNIGATYVVKVWSRATIGIPAGRVKTVRLMF